ncbi:MAG TPA: hypothetical protein VHN18_12570, partial [Micromonosporaceae bacterium]|nr:hypothetical protein [Micromonosporaceae bacterium]
MRLHAQAQQKRARRRLRALGTQLQSMASKSEQDCAAKEVVRHGRFVHGPAWFDQFRLGHDSVGDCEAGERPRNPGGRLMTLPRQRAGGASDIFVPV